MTFALFKDTVRHRSVIVSPSADTKHQSPISKFGFVMTGDKFCVTGAKVLVKATGIIDFTKFYKIWLNFDILAPAGTDLRVSNYPKYLIFDSGRWHIEIRAPVVPG